MQWASAASGCTRSGPSGEHQGEESVPLGSGSSLTLFVKNLLYSATTLDVADHFTSDGVDMAKITIPPDRCCIGKNRGFAIITIADATDVYKALMLSGSQLLHRTLEVEAYVPTRKQTLSEPPMFPVFLSQREWMFSRSNHHDQEAPANVAHPTPHSTPQPVVAGWLPSTDPSTDHLSAHYHRLEFLLDSALAALTLILDNATTPTFTDHTTDVLRALYRRTMPTCPSPIPASPDDPTPSPTPPKSATYADAVMSTAPDHAEKPTEADSDITKPTENRASHRAVPDLIFRLDLLPSAPSVRPHPTALFKALAAEPATTRFRLGGVRWTQNGNLTINFMDNAYRPESALDQAPAIWKVVRPLLRLPKQYACPRVDRGGSWHSVVVHDVPVLPRPDGPGYDPHSESASEWLPPVEKNSWRPPSWLSMPRFTLHSEAHIPTAQPESLVPALGPSTPYASSPTSQPRLICYAFHLFFHTSYSIHQCLPSPEAYTGYLTLQTVYFTNQVLQFYF
ncbi:hypothetical protein B0H13DRAFT_2303825 [Mycena leptocephala]|nr:hypothetical protein B0H13DRAFT_2303825 [Mycena leptocephala]